MRAPHRLLEDVTKATISAMADDLVIKALDIKGNRNVLASGIIRRLPIADGLQINLGYLRGQSAYAARAQGTPGLTVEVRLQGHSTARRVDYIGPKHEVRPGEYFILAQKAPVDWEIEAPAQEVFKTVSITFAEDVITSLGDAGLTAASDMLFAKEQHLHGPSPSSLVALAETLFSLSPERPFEVLRARNLAMGILLEAMSHQVPEAHDPSHADQQVVDRAKTFIRQNLGVALKIEDVARHFRMSASALKKAFSDATGGSIGAFIKEERMARTDQLLRQGVSISDVAQTFGYSAPEAFARAFRTHFGYPPSQVKKRTHPSVLAKVSD